MVMREERTQTPLLCVPHQRVLFDFVWAHPQCVIRMPVGASKSFCMAALTLWLLGRDNTVRGAVISATQEQAQKVVGLVRDYIEHSQALRIVFPNLRRSPRIADAWTQTELTVDRPPGIRDPSLIAKGIDGALPGARLAWVVVDDVLSRENTSTPAGRAKVNDFFSSTVLSRLTGSDARIVVTNTPWHLDDLSHRLERAGMPTLTMDAEGGVNLAHCPAFDTNDIRPSRRTGEWYRLAAHDPDPTEDHTLWNLVYPRDRLDQLRADYSARGELHRYLQLYMCQCRDEDTARCKTEWVEQCKRPGLTCLSEYRGANPTVTGVDLAVGKTSAHDSTCFFTFECLPNGKRRILDVEVGQWDGPTIVKKLLAKAKAYNSIVRVESNAAQAYVRQFALAQNASVPVKAHTTTAANKHHVNFGVESMFIELQNGAWEIPCNHFGVPPAGVQKWIAGCLNYQPDEHVDDALIASWLAREQARELGFGNAAPTGQQPRGLGVSIMSR